MTSRTHGSTSGAPETPGPGAPPAAPVTAPDPDSRLAELHRTAAEVATNVARVLVGKRDVVHLALVTLLAGGHLLLEDVPGVGKTSLARALARSIDCTTSRIQFTPDLLPSDVTGISIFNRRTNEFEFRPGPVFANIVVADEINRASPKTQSALLESMQEQHVTVDTTTYRLADPFMVIATQNPVEMAGTHALPEAQQDRFTARISVGYPDGEAELAMVDEHAGHDPLQELRPVCDAATIRELVTIARSVHMSPELRRYAVELVTATRTAPRVLLGASPRATLQFVRAARAHAALAGRAYVVPDDLQAMAVPVLAHRLVLTNEAHVTRYEATEVIETIVTSMPVPHGGSPHADGADTNHASGRRSVR